MSNNEFEKYVDKDIVCLYLDADGIPILKVDSGPGWNNIMDSAGMYLEQSILYALSTSLQQK